ncbi:MAG TPA: hypothetical protein DIW47_11525 [Bacteroidetes bacterium]|nr:hypothetical protein [Bacteroidota bacterium]
MISCDEFLNNTMRYSKDFSVMNFWPCSNPANRDEFCYVSGDMTNHELRVHNMKTNKNYSVGKGTFYGEPIWSSNGYIYVINNNYEIEKHNRLTKSKSIIFSGYGTIAYLSSSPLGDKLILQRVEADSLQSIVISEDGAILDRFYYTPSYTDTFLYYQGTWYSEDNVVVSSLNCGIAKTSFSSRSIDSISPRLGKKPWDCLERVYGCESCENYYAIILNDGIWKIDVNNGSSTVIKSSCILKEYLSLNLLDQNTALVTKEICQALDYSRLVCRRAIFTLDLQSGKETEIVLP